MDFLTSTANPKTNYAVEPRQSKAFDFEQLEMRINLTDPTLVPSQSTSFAQSSSSKKDVSSPCEILEPFASFNHHLIRTNRQDYETEVKTPILLALSNLPDVSFFYKDSFHSFSCKLSHGSTYRLFEIDCFWDPSHNEHVVDVRQVGGVGFHKFACDLTVEITKVFDASFKAPGLAARSWMQVRPVPASLINQIESEIIRDGGPSLLESFSKGIDNIMALAKHDFMDTRVQALQLLCDLSDCNDSSRKNMLCDANVVPKVVSIVQEGLSDQFQEVRDFAVIAAEILATAFPTYQTALGQNSPVVATLLAQLRCYPDAEAYLHLHTIRAAARALVKLVVVATKAVRQEVAALLNYRKVFDWQQFVASLRDEQTKNAASQLTQLFEEQSFLIPSSSSASTANEVDSSKLLRNHFYLQESTLSGAIQKLLAGFQSLTPYQVATSFLAVENRFFSKVVSRSEVSVFVTSVYFDTEMHDHVAELKRISGDGSFMRGRDFFGVVRSVMLTDVVEPQGKPIEDAEGENLLIGCEQLTFEQFLASISHIITFALNPHPRSRVEGVKMLINSLQTRQYATYLQEMECVRLIVTALSELLRDTEAEVHELAVLAFAAFASWHVNFAKEFALQSENLLELVRVTPVTDMHCYQNALKIRAAVSTLKHIALALPETARESIRNSLKIESRESWAEFIGALVSNDGSLDCDLQSIGFAVF